VTTTSRRSTTDPAIISLEAMGKDIARRKANLGVPDLPRYSGMRRMASKQALPKVIKYAGVET